VVFPHEHGGGSVNGNSHGSTGGRRDVSVFIDNDDVVNAAVASSTSATSASHDCHHPRSRRNVPSSSPPSGSGAVVPVGGINGPDPHPPVSLQQPLLLSQPVREHVTIEFSVSDTGLGIDSSTLREGIFTPFMQSDISSTKRFAGIGLGLTVVKALVKQMGGKLSVHSEWQKGSTFAFTIDAPVCDPSEVSSAAMAANLPLSTVVTPELDGNAALQQQQSPQPHQHQYIHHDHQSQLQHNSPSGVVVGVRPCSDALADTVQSSALNALSTLPPSLSLPAAAAHPIASTAASSAPVPPVSSSPANGDRSVAAATAAAAAASLAITVPSTPASSPPLAMFPASSATPVASNQQRPPVASASPGTGTGSGRTTPSSARPVRRLHPASVLRILCADDQPINQKVLRRLLEAEGHKVVMVEDGLQAVQAFQASLASSSSSSSVLMPVAGSGATVASAAAAVNGAVVPAVASTSAAAADTPAAATVSTCGAAVPSPSPALPFDLVLLDVCMPVLDGLQACKRIRELENNNNKEGKEGGTGGGANGGGGSMPASSSLASVLSAASSAAPSPRLPLAAEPSAAVDMLPSSLNSSSNLTSSNGSTLATATMVLPPISPRAMQLQREHTAPLPVSDVATTRSIVTPSLSRTPSLSSASSTSSVAAAGSAAAAAAAAAAASSSLLFAGRLPIYAVTASGMDKAACGPAGLNDVIYKPLHPAALRAVLRPIEARKLQMHVQAVAAMTMNAPSAVAEETVTPTAADGTPLPSASPPS
jgi:CheY-like chemotaxis protein